MLSENMASLGGEELLSKKTTSVEDAPTTLTSLAAASEKHDDTIRKPIDREDRLRIMKDRQNEERQRKLEELKAQALAAQKYREQKEDERRRRIDDMRSKEMDRKQQVEERKKAIMDAENDRREYILRKNQERDSRIETKRRNERSSIAFAFGSSTPRLLDPVDVGSMSPSSMWGHRRSTSITNVAYSGAPLSRRSSERELSDTPKKRATSAGGLDRNEDQRKMSTSMYEVFNWGHLNDGRPKRYSLAIAGSHIDIDDPPAASSPRNSYHVYNKIDDTDSAPLSYRSVARRKTDLMPTIPSPRESSFGSRSSLYCHTPRTPGRAVSMTRLDQLAQPTRRNGEHIRAVIERQRQQHHNDSMSVSVSSNFSHSPTITTDTATAKKARSMSRSLTHLAGHTTTTTTNGGTHKKLHNHRGTTLRPLIKTDTSKSMTHLVTAKLARSAHTPRSKGRHADQQSDSVSVTGSRSGDVTPGASRPGSALSTSTSVSGVLYRRTTQSARKPRPASIAGTDDVHKQRKEKPPIPRVQSTMRKSMTTSSTNGINSTSTTAPPTPKETPKRSTSAEKRAVSSSAKKAPTSRSAGVATPKTAPPPAVTPVAAADQPASKVEREVMFAQDLVVTIADSSIDTIATDATYTEQEDLEKTMAQVVDEIVTAAEQAVVQKSQINSWVASAAASVGAVVSDAENDHEEVAAVSLPYVPSPDAKETVVTAEQSVDVPAIDISFEQQQEPQLLQQPQQQQPTPQQQQQLLKSMNESHHFDVTWDRPEHCEMMTASMIARRITTEDEAKAALAERRRLARIEAERVAELERQRQEAAELAEEQRIAEEEETQRRLEEETLRLVGEQRKAEELRLSQAIEEAAQREEEERMRKEDEEKQRIEREELERKARKEAELAKIEVAERLKKEEKEREERRKRVEAIMSRTRAKGTPNNTPNKNDEKDTEKSNENVNLTTSNINTGSEQTLANADIGNGEPEQQTVVAAPAVLVETSAVVGSTVNNRSGDYEQSVTDKENALFNSFSNLIENNQHNQQQNLHHQLQQQEISNVLPTLPASNGKAGNGKVLDFDDLVNEDHQLIMRNGNGHTEHSIDNNKIESTGVVVSTNNFVSSNDNKQQQDSMAGQLIDFSLGATVDPVNFNNNSLLNTSATLVTSDSHEHKEISLL